MDDIGLLIGGAFLLGVAFLIVLIAIIGWAQDKDRSRQ